MTGVILGEPNEVYHADPAISNTKLFAFHQQFKARFGSTVLWKEQYLDGTIQKPRTKPMDFGNLVHTLLFEGPDAMNAEYVFLDVELNFQGADNKMQAIRLLNSLQVEPVTDENILAGLCKGKRSDIEEFFGSRPSRPVFTPADKALAELMVNKVRQHEQARCLLSNGYPEVTFRSDRNTRLGFPVQCRTDWWNPEGCEETQGVAYAVDLKTVESLELFDDRWFMNKGYHRSFPFYRATTEATLGAPAFDEFILIVAEKKYPYEVITLKPDQDSYEKGFAEVNGDLERLQAYFQTGVWPVAGAYGTMPIGLPSFYRGE